MGIFTTTIELSPKNADRLQKHFCLFDLPYELELEVEYTVLGGYYPATYFEPEEFPEVEITSITINGTGNCVINKKVPFVDELVSTEELETLAFEEYENDDFYLDEE